MANPDRPSGFRFVKTLSGAPVAAVMRSIGVTDSADIFKGDMISLTTNLGVVSATNDATFLGIAAGFGKITQMQGEFGPALNPDDLTKLYYDDSANTHTDWRVFYVPVDDAIFEVQSDIDLNVSVGDTVDLLVTTAGNADTGISGQQVGQATSNTDFLIIDIPPYPDNDSTLANTRYHITVSKAEMFAQ